MTSTSVSVSSCCSRRLVCTREVEPAAFVAEVSTFWRPQGFARNVKPQEQYQSFYSIITFAFQEPMLEGLGMQYRIVIPVSQIPRQRQMGWPRERFRVPWTMPLGSSYDQSNTPNHVPLQAAVSSVKSELSTSAEEQEVSVCRRFSPGWLNLPCNPAGLLANLHRLHLLEEQNQQLTKDEISSAWLALVQIFILLHGWPDASSSLFGHVSRDQNPWNISRDYRLQKLISAEGRGRESCIRGRVRGRTCFVPCSWKVAEATKTHKAYTP